MLSCVCCSVAAYVNSAFTNVRKDHNFNIFSCNTIRLCICDCNDLYVLDVLDVLVLGMLLSNVLITLFIICLYGS